LTQHLAGYLPQKPLALLPQAAFQSVPDEGKQESEEHVSPIQHVGEALLYVSRLTQDLTKHAAKVTHQRARQAVEFMHDTARYAAVRVEGNSAGTHVKGQASQSPPSSLSLTIPSTETIVEQTTQHMTVLPLPSSSPSDCDASDEKPE
jgi:hypothetical protein